MSEQNHRWSRDDAAAVWWQDQQSLQHQQIIQQQQQQQQLAAAQASTAAATGAHPLFTYKMASSFQNPTTTISNVSSTSPVGAAGVRGYDYRLGGGNPTGPAQPAQWWYPNVDNNMQNSMQNMSPPPGSQQSQHQQQAQLVHQQHQQQAEAHRQQQQHEEAHRQHQEAQRQHQEAHRQHQEAQHRQAIAEAQARHQQQQQQHQNHLHQQSVLQQQQQITQVQAPVATKGRMPRGKGDARPKGRMTAYAFFVQTCREEHKKKHPEENVVFTEFTKKCAERWKTMLDKEKKRFHEMAEKDKKRYDTEMQNYTPPKGEKTRGKKRKQTKDPNAPKRSLSAFFWFCNDERSKVKGLNPEYGVGDIAKELGRRWSDADPETKAKYDVMAERDKARYEKEMTAYKKKNNPSMQAPVPEPEEEEEADEEAEEDDDE